ncbi:MAG: LacI family DNA-binding transcriptional regulator [Solirubrobacteraceae bacterium]|jgi:LacI family transcriptional regulator
MNPASGTAPRRPSRKTIGEIAELAGVSVATVSRVVNGRSGVSAEKRKAVQRVVREHGYSPTLSARGLSAGRTGLIGVTVPLIQPSYFALIVGGITEAAQERDLRVVLCPTEFRHEREISLLERLMHGSTDGGLLVFPEESSDELRTLLNHGYRFVVLDSNEKLDDDIPVISAAHASGAQAAMELLVGLGHRRIGAITGPSGWVATEQRLHGYCATLAAAGIALDPELVVESRFEVGHGTAEAGQLLDLPQRPTAIFAFNDNLAIATMQAARERGLRLPEQLSVVGFDDVGEAAIVTPPLTTVRQPLAEMGRLAISLLNRQLEGRRLEALHVELATRLVVRDSAVPPPTR